ncbi:ribonuclease III domain-containing protein [Xylaria intraflava]|nr:ribonuclease III domain-containing protein [Xylaria intraflava]
MDIIDDAAKAKKLRIAQKIIKYKFQDEDLLWEALQAPGSNVTELRGQRLDQGNKALANLGDSVIALVIKHYGYKVHYNIGLINSELNTLASNYRFTTLCDTTGLTACINANPSQRDDIAPRLRADTLEAVVGAVYHESGIDKATLVIQTLGIIDKTIG